MARTFKLWNDFPTGGGEGGSHNTDRMDRTTISRAPWIEAVKYVRHARSAPGALDHGFQTVTMSPLCVEGATVWDTNNRDSASVRRRSSEEDVFERWHTSRLQLQQTTASPPKKVSPSINRAPARDYSPPSCLVDDECNDDEKASGLQSSIRKRSRPWILETQTTIGIEDRPRGAERPIDWPRIQKLRMEILVLRSHIRSLRTNMKDLRGTISQVQDAMLQRSIRLDLGMVNPRPAADQLTLNQLKSDYQEAADAYGPVEDECSRIEDALSAKEFQLTRLEEDYYLKQDQNTQACSIRGEQYTFPAYPLHPPSHSSSTSSQGDVAETMDLHPLVAEYFSKLGDLDLLQESLDEILDEDERLKDEKERRRGFDLKLAPDDQQWLDDSHDREAELRRQIDTVDTEVIELRRACFAQGLIDEDGEPKSLLIHEQDLFKDDLDIKSQDHTSEYMKYPILLPTPGQPVHREDIMISDSQENPDLTTRRIDDWILDRTRMTALDVNLLEGVYEHEVGKTDQDWEHSVLKLWYKNMTEGLSKKTHKYSESMSTQAVFQSDPSDPVSKRLLNSQPLETVLTTS